MPLATLIFAPLAAVVAQTADVDRYQRLERMHHTAGTARDGLAGEPTSLAQTTDGFLWIGTTDGVYRFDGVRFEAYQPTRGSMGALAVSALTADPRGGLWVGHSLGGLTFLAPDGTATSYTMADSLPMGEIRSIVVDHHRVVWVAVVGGVARLEAGRWKKIRSEWGYRHLSAWRLFVDRHGTLWISAASPDGMLFLPKGGRRFVDLQARGPAQAFAELDDSTVVYAHRTAPSLHLMRRDGDRAALVQTIETFSANWLTVDQDGGAWLPGLGVNRLRLTTQSSGATRAHPVERFGPGEGLSGRYAKQALIDREGTVWVISESGLDRFRRRNLSWIPDSLAQPSANFVTDADGEVWLLNSVAPALRRARDLTPVPGAPISLDNGMLDHEGTIWLSTLKELVRWDGRRFAPVPPPRQVVERKLPFFVLSLMRERSGRLWAGINGAGAFTLVDSTWTFKPILEGRADWTPASIAADTTGRVWLMYPDELAMVHDDRVRVYSKPDGLDVGTLTSLRSHEGTMWVSGERGLAFLRGDRFYPVQAAHNSGLGSVAYIVPAADGLWLGGSAGIIRIPRGEIARLSVDPAHRVSTELFDLESDLPDPLRVTAIGWSHRWGVAGGDGVLWFVTQNGLARVDPRQIVRNPHAPPVAFRAVIAEDSAWSPTGEIKLPPLTRTLRIEYTALSLAMPERVRFRHQLEGWEDVWHEADNQREVTYTDLGPGRYALHVTASNNDGVWNETGSTLQFTVLPAWFQTTLFRLSVAALILATAVAAYRLRIRRVSAALAVRYDERLAERTRIARDLHDTLLQTVQGSKIVADDALDRPDDTDRLRHAMKRVSEWLGQAAEEGRAALNSLRGSVAAADLTEALRRAADNPTRPPTLSVSVETRGTRRTLHPVVQDEIYRIGYEGIRNACLHSRATRLDIELEYGHDLVLRMTDDGVGLGSAAAGGGKPGHFGIAGMRERAANIGATLSVDSTQPGTRVTLVVPGRSVFRVGSSKHPSR